MLVLAAVGCSATSPDSQKQPASEVRGQNDERLPNIPEPYQIELTGSKDRWQVRYPGYAAGIAAEGDVRNFPNIHVPLRTKVILLLKSTDYVYILALPQLNLKEIAVPDLEFPLEICLTESGRFELVGNPLCGDPHSELESFLIAEPADRFLEWLKSTDTSGAD